MGYTHYYYTSKEFDAESFAKVAADFKKMVTPLKHLGVVLADGLGENYPTISPTEIRFNGLEKCGHTKRDLGITWPSKTASGISANKVDYTLQELTKSSWFAGAHLESRVCGGDCSHETFSIQQKLETTLTRYDGSKYEMESKGEFAGYTNQDGTQNRTPENEIGKYFQCTKTAYKPYDLAVTVCLVIAKHHLGENIIVHSDGTMENWHEAMQLCHHFLGYGKGFCLDDDESVPLDKEDANAMVSQYKKNKQEIASLKESQEKLEEEQKEKISQISQRYCDTIRELEKQQYLETGKLQDQIDTAKEKTDSAISELSKIKATLDRVIYFLKQQQKKFDCTPLDEITNHSKHLELIEKYQDKCMSIHMYIAENRRPKNKYSIIIVGKSKLGSSNRDDSILVLPHSYGVDLHCQNADILSDVKHFTSVDGAKKYHKTHGIQKVLKEFLEKYNDVKSEYEQTCKKYSLDDFATTLHEKFVAYWKYTSHHNREIVAKELNLGTENLEEMTLKQIQLLMQKEANHY